MFGKNNPQDSPKIPSFGNSSAQRGALFSPKIAPVKKISFADDQENNLLLESLYSGRIINNGEQMISEFNRSQEHLINSIIAMVVMQIQSKS